MPRIISERAAPLPLDANTRFQNREVFTSSGTFTPPAGVTRVWVTAWGGGSGAHNGSGGTSYMGGTGGDGVFRALVAVTPSVGVTVTIGTGGAQGNVGSSAPGAGGVTSFGAALSVSGGEISTGFIVLNSGNAIVPAPPAPATVEGMYGSGGRGEIAATTGGSISCRGGAGAFGSNFGRGGSQGLNAGAGAAGALIVEW